MSDLNSSMSKVTFQPAEGRILVKLDPKEKETVSGIVIPDIVKDERPVTGTVVVGNSKYYADSRVLLSKYATDEVTIEGELYAVVHEAGVLGVF